LGHGEEAVDEFLVCLGIGIGDKTRDVVGSGGQSDDIEVEAADERAAIGFGGWFE